MYETTSFAGSPSDRLYLSVTRRTREERQALFDSYEVSPPPLVFHTLDPGYSLHPPWQSFFLAFPYL